MSETAIRYRNRVMGSVYQHILKPVFFRYDPEFIHDRMTGVGKTLGKFQLGKKITRGLFGYHHPMLEQKILGIEFKNPIGLSAGFDKNAELVDILPSVGFGFAEIGSVTGEPCIGNDRPRLWRLKNSKGLVVYYGLKNDGCNVVRGRLQGKEHGIPIGVSVAMTNNEDTLNLTHAVKDFAKAFKTMEPVGDYITVNVSCPNTLGGQPFITPCKLDYLLDVLDEIPTTKPIFIKLSPDLKRTELDELLSVAYKHRVSGIVCTNLTKKRDNPKIVDSDVPSSGGISGKVVQNLSDRMLAYIYKQYGSRFVLVGCGGVFSAEDAYKKIRLGASLVEMITGMIFEGPQVISQINQGLVALLTRDGFKTISDAVGIDNKNHE